MKKLPPLLKCERIYLNVPYERNGFARATHCGYDSKLKLWFTGPQNRFLKELIELYGVNEATAEAVREKIYTEWDPDFVKVTADEAKRIENAENSGFVDANDVDWEQLGSEPESNDATSDAARETAYLESIPGMKEKLIRGRETPVEECLSESLVGVLSSDVDDKKAREERLEDLLKEFDEMILREAEMEMDELLADPEVQGMKPSEETLKRFRAMLAKRSENSENN